MIAEVAGGANILEEPSAERSPGAKSGQNWQRSSGKAFDSIQMDYDRSLYDEEVNAEDE